QQDRQCHNHDQTPLVEDSIAHGERADNPDPDLARLACQVCEWLSKLWIQSQSAVEFSESGHIRLAVASVACDVGQTKQALLNAFGIDDSIRFRFGRGVAHLDLARASISAMKSSSRKPPVASISWTRARNSSSSNVCLAHSIMSGGIASRGNGSG